MAKIMNTLAINELENRFDSFKNGNAKKTRVSKPVFQFLDNRNEYDDQRKLQEMANCSASAEQTALLQAMADGFPEYQRIKKVKGNYGLPSTARTKNSEADVILQRAVSNSLTYVPDGNSQIFINALNTYVEGAEQRAVDAATQSVLLVVDSPTMAAYKNSPTPMLWGSCVEEQLNAVARDIGWATQYPLTYSRPDYHRTENGASIFVDLTTPSQAAGSGNHITEKLNRDWVTMGRPNWHAADITYATAPPHLEGELTEPVPNGQLNKLHVQAVQQYNQVYASRDYEPWANVMQEYFKYAPHISIASFTQIWDEEERALFFNNMQAAQNHPEDYEPESEDD
ncbi:hypothetical protein [Teredinibacter turnerae]|uniref:hypothetical protein n=1 Tax=Teredinibacter turnerae TaxID=2426 RepID=UPI00035D376F|nr:hypothetical protein [Teredinibacter turnerae]